MNAHASVHPPPVAVDFRKDDQYVIESLVPQLEEIARLLSRKLFKRTTKVRIRLNGEEKWAEFFVVKDGKEIVKAQLSVLLDKYGQPLRIAVKTTSRRNIEAEFALSLPEEACFEHVRRL
jgi:hypothetical protein